MTIKSESSPLVSPILVLCVLPHDAATHKCVEVFRYQNPKDFFKRFLRRFLFFHPNFGTGSQLFEHDPLCFSEKTCPSTASQTPISWDTAKNGSPPADWWYLNTETNIGWWREISVGTAVYVGSYQIISGCRQAWKMIFLCQNGTSC